jgi:hypothetical protein
LPPVFKTEKFTGCVSAPALHPLGHVIANLQLPIANLKTKCR